MPPHIGTDQPYPRHARSSQAASFDNCFQHNGLSPCMDSAMFDSLDGYGHHGIPEMPPETLCVQAFPSTNVSRAQQQLSLDTNRACIFGESGHYIGGSGSFFPAFDFNTSVVPRCYTIQPPEIYFPRQGSPAEQSMGASSQWSTSHFDEASTPQTGICSVTSASDHDRDLLQYKDFTDPSAYRNDNLAGGGIAMSAIQVIPDRTEPMGRAYESADESRDGEYDEECELPQQFPLCPPGSSESATSELIDEHVHYAREDSVMDTREEVDDDASSDYKPSKSTARGAKRPSAYGCSPTKPNGIRKQQGRNRCVQPKSPAGKQLITKTNPRNRANSKSSDKGSGSASNRHFPCPFAGYGCPATFSAKNEWKRHVSTQHIKLGYWRCDLCTPPTASKNRETYNDFNRKDLFTQHLRRMHTIPLAAASGALPLTIKKYSANGSNNKALAQLISENVITQAQTRCYVELRATPSKSSCLLCPSDFSGPTSWYERMDHIGAHFESDRKGTAGIGVEVEDGNLLDCRQWRADPDLEAYLANERLIVKNKVNGKWTIADGVAA